MAAPSYATDLQDVDLAEANTNWAEPTYTGWTLGAAPGTADTENIIQGTYSIPKAFNATGVGGVMANAGSGKTIPTDGAFLCWVFWASPNALESEANGGVRLIAGNALNVFYGCKAGGKDTYLYGGWINLAFDPNQSGARDYTAGSPSGTWQYFGWVVNNTNAITKGSPFVADAIRYGRCEFRVSGGESANYATFAGMAAKNDANDASAGYNRWGLFQSTGGTYLWKGLITLGYGAVVDFRDASRTIIVDGNVKKVSSNFNKIEIKQASSRVDWTAISFISLSTVARGNFEVIDNADVNLDACTFTDLGTFIFQSNSTILNSTFARCGQVTQGSAIFTGCKFTGSTGAAALLVSAITGVTDCDFVSAGTGYAVQGFSAAGDYDLSSLSFSGYAASNGSTGNEAIYVTATSGVVNLSVSGGTPSVRTAGATVNILSDQITLTLSPIVTGSDVVIYDAGTTTILANSQNLSGTSYDYIYDGTDVGVDIDIGIFKEGYTPFYTRAYVLGASDTIVPIAQQIDRFYLT